MEALDGCTDVFGNDEWSNSTMREEDPSSLAEKFSEFGDSSCGEPLYSQRILLDFTPDEEIDNDYVQKKCCEFWNFINSRPEIQHLMVMPERLQDIQMSDAPQGSSEVSMSDVEEKGRPKSIHSRQRTALSMLEFAEDKGLIDRTFEAKIHESHCTMGSREYKELQKGTERKKIQCGGTCMRTESGVVSALCICNPPKPTPLKTLVRTMQEWDPKHPKSFEPPSHPPSLQHCVLQRKPVSSNRFN